MMVMNSDLEDNDIPDAIAELLKDLAVCNLFHNLSV